jgi:serine/threonine protein kinase
VNIFRTVRQWFVGSNVPVVDIARRFELLGKSGQGSMARVGPAKDRETGKIVCLKILDKAQTESFEKRFAGLHRPTEGALSMTLSHRNIVKTLEHGLTTTGEPYLVMELIDGVGLNYLIETRHSQLDGRRLDFARQLADGLAYLHDQGYFHRDICPRNVMVTKDHVVKYIDFGLAIPNRPEFRRPGNRTGTPAYLAPEVLKRQPTDQRVDLFALGVTIYELFVGKTPWDKARNAQEAINHLRNPGKDPRSVRLDLDEATAHLLLKAVERDPKARFQTAQELRQALDTITCRL